MRSRKLGLAFLAVAAALVPAAAFAQPSTSASALPYPAACAADRVPAGESERAHKVYESGKVQYDDKNYEAAIQQFRDAYKRDCSKHDLLIIISRAYELKGDRNEAKIALETYLERVPNSPDAPTYRTGIENLKRQIAAQPPPAPTTVATSTPVEMREHTLPPWLVVGVGGATIIFGLVLVIVTPSLPPKCSADTSTCTKIDGESASQFTDRQKQAGQHVEQPRNGAIVMGAGVAVAAVGLIWHFLEPTGPVEKTASVTPAVTPAVAPGFAGLSLGGSF